MEVSVSRRVFYRRREGPRRYTSVVWMSGAKSVLFIGGRAGVGKTRVALELHWQLAAQGVKHCVVEGDTLDQAYPPPWEHGHKLAEQNLKAMWANYRALGYRRMIYTNTVSVLETASLSAAMGDAPLVKAVLLRASDDTVKGRLELRESAATLQSHLNRSRLKAAGLGQQTPSWVWRIDTDGKDSPAVAAEILELLSWT